MTRAEVPMPAPAALPDVDPAGREPTGPMPPRYWWLKRLIGATVGLAVLLVGIWAGWGAASHRRLARRLAPIVAAGEPVNAAGMNPPRFPEDENGAALFRNAFSVLNQTVPSPANSTLDYTGYPPFPPRWHRLADQAIPPNGKSLDLMRQARGFRRFDWGVRATSPAYGVLLPHLNNARALANFVGDAALYAHLHGDDFEALERIRDVRKEAEALDVPPLFIVTHLVAIGCEAVAISRLEVIAPGLAVGPEDSAPGARPATPSQVRALIAELLDDAPMVEGLHLAYIGERAAQMDMVEWFGRNMPVLRPMFELDGLRVADKTDATVRVAAISNWPAARDALRNDPVLRNLPPAQTSLPSLFVGPGRGSAARSAAAVDYTRLLSTDVCVSPGVTGGRPVETDMKLRAERRMAAVSLAVRLYRADHDDQFPTSLAALVPAYLPSIPTDPFSADGKPLGYVVVPRALPGGADRPLVYSVGRDGADDTAAGNLAGLPKSPCFGFDTNTPDQWRDLSRWAPAMSPEQQKQEEAMEKEAATRPAGGN